MKTLSLQRLLRCLPLLLIGALPLAAEASFLHGEALDAVADFMAVVVLIIVPPSAIAIFWIVHVLPEKIAHKKHHPQTPAITTLCLLSLVFGGLLWPVAWLWAFTKPVMHKMAYGTDKSEEFHALEEAGKAALERIEASEKADVAALMNRIAALEARLNQTQGGAR
ncbi:DUF3302 domain-containing protein [Uliginosibacterium aquaticum]|uniref:DUF3302 domain-containing protein n=1 Tax=Uliginosibacterium aquaticum TaxID=2731212 RepID=UPI001C2D70DF|nr:DUF3302 domain-containing protein [Uliginosibacterium aquaticum]